MTARRAGPHDDGRAAPLPPSGGKRSLDAVALTTSDGLLSAGKGKVDLDELSALGAGTKRTTAAFWDDTMHVTRFDVNDIVLCLTSMGAPVRDDAAVGSLMRILAA